jgi:hypothetical protein
VSRSLSAVRHCQQKSAPNGCSWQDPCGFRQDSHLDTVCYGEAPAGGSDTSPSSQLLAVMGLRLHNGFRVRGRTRHPLDGEEIPVAHQYEDARQVFEAHHVSHPPDALQQVVAGDQNVLRIVARCPLLRCVSNSLSTNPPVTLVIFACFLDSMPKLIVKPSPAPAMFFRCVPKATRATLN